MERIEQHASFGGRQEVWRHTSEELRCAMNVGVYLPPAALAGTPCPVLYWLSGLTCTEQNFITKAGAQQYASTHGVIIVVCDTSPRGVDVANDDSHDLGQGAGFYVDATQAPWSAHFRMESYVVRELPALIERHFKTSDVRGICGHSMGGHGALTLALRHPGRYVSVSALAPIVAPTQVPWGERAFGAYLGDDRSLWRAHDATELVATAKERLPILIDQGLDDEFLSKSLKPELFEAACAAAGHPLTVRRHEGYDHGYYFVASFVGDHIAHHARAFSAKAQRA